jgi:hypothetical protein
MITKRIQKSKTEIKARPNSSGMWRWRPDASHQWVIVQVDENPTAGRYCRSLRMGGSAQHVGGEFTGQWQKA